MSADRVPVTIVGDLRQAELARDVQDGMRARIGSSPADRADAYAELYRRGLGRAAEWFCGQRLIRRKLDPRRLLDAWHERACRQHLSELAEPPRPERAS